MTSDTGTAADPRLLRRSDFPEFQQVTTRWADNDMYGHLNNAVYYELFDAVLNAWLIRETGTDEVSTPTLGVVAESSCRFYQELAYPEPIDVGVRVERIGTKSVTFAFGLFAEGSDEIAAHGLWAQVYIDRAQRNSVPIPDDVRAVAERALAAQT
ncbi:acyl-CoA thioesterase [Knoellia subterranea]|uniref:4-hydroxybenzoyl-CoA thioesterase n=1 Tax=Knoellia subterranea KCTC 19937 TaxID=1385521 RepID=A0A0A0JJ55_9MICO|nr:thioesterase family protein [Knoellia subterranea]KGN37445.1 4-hydroxybenzoyl-CoA thioesterase [Knoellia subterranea KCTC 19937]